MTDKGPLRISAQVGWYCTHPSREDDRPHPGNSRSKWTGSALSFLDSPGPVCPRRQPVYVEQPSGNDSEAQS